MKIYVVDLDMTTLDVEKIKKKVQTKSKSATLREFIVKRIYSEKGIIEIDKFGKLWNIEIQDDMEPVIYKMDEQIRLYIDRSIVRKKEEVFQIVPEHVSMITKKCICNLSPNSMLQMVIEMNYHDNNVRDIYFETEIDILHHSVKEDILTFLALLNFVEYI
jgi:hypothetical protein